MLRSRICGGIIGKKKIRGKWGWSSERYISEEQKSASTQGYAPIPMHSSEPPQGGDTGEELKATAASKPSRTTANEPDPLVPPTSSSPRLLHTGVGRSSEPNAQQRLSLSSYSDGAESLKAQEEDNKEYFKHHKLEFSDTRKPVTQSTDSPTSYYVRDQGVILWKPEQLDTAEDSLLRAVEIWKWNKMRGDPHSPHGRVLRELRGEYW